MQKPGLNPSAVLTLVLLVLLSIIPLAVAAGLPRFLGDDPFITLTYARNLASGHGFVYNQPPAVLGTTTPLYTLLVAGLAVLFGPTHIPSLAVLLTAFCWLGVMWVLFFFRREWGLKDWQVCLLGAVVVATGWIRNLGMEAYLFAFLLMLTFSLFLRRRFFLAGICGGMLFLTRGEGALAPLLLALTLPFLDRVGAFLKFDRQTFFRELYLGAGFTAVTLPWMIYARFTFGSFLPNTLAAKQAQAQSGLWQPFFTRLTSEWIPHWGDAFRLKGLPAFNLWWMLVLAGLIFVLLRWRFWLLPLIWMFLYLAGYSLLKVAGYAWYQLPALFVLELYFGLGLIALIELLLKFIRQKTVAVSLGSLLAAVFLIVLTIPTVRSWVGYQGDSRGPSYLNLSRWFDRNASPRASISYMEVGYLGYFTDNRIVDLVGLTSPQALAHVRQGDLVWSFWQAQPDYFVYLPDFDYVLAGIRADPRFDRFYVPVATLPGPRTTDFVIYQRTGK